jgi:hypothetical protein
MAVVTISTNKFSSAAGTAGVTLNPGDTLNVLAGIAIVSSGTGSSPGILGTGSNSILLNGDVFSNSSNGITEGGSCDVNVGAGSTVFGGGSSGMLFSAGSNSIGIADK